MKRRVLFAAVLGATAWLTPQSASAFGGRKKNNCDTGCNTGCGTTACDVTYVDQKVTALKAEWKTKKVEIDVTEFKMVDEKYKYIVCEQVKSKAKVKVSEITHVKSKEKRVVCETVCVAVQIPCAAPASCDTGCGRERKGLFARLCHKNDCNDPCPKPCATACETPCAPVMKAVMQRQIVKREVEVDVVRCVPVWVEKEVNVFTMVRVEKEGTHKVCKPFTTKQTVEQKYSVMVPYETTVKVAVRTPHPAPAPCAAPCATSSCGDSCATKARSGLFHRCCK